MADFGEYKKVKTKKVHQCITCNRIIPIGKQAITYKGMYDGIWQNWYCCMACNDKNLLELLEEGINDNEFNYWLYESEHMDWLCGLKHQHRYCSKWEWTEDQESVVITCEVCNKERTVFIGWGEEHGTL